MELLSISFGNEPPNPESMKKLLTPYHGANLQLKNHIVMAPMTRSRAIGNLPNALMAQ